jgi:hypothetical protein
MDKKQLKNIIREKINSSKKTSPQQMLENLDNLILKMKKDFNIKDEELL